MFCRGLFYPIASPLRRSIAVGIALSRLGAAVVWASPMRADLEMPRHPKLEQATFAPLARGPAISLSRADSSDEDCVQTAKVLAPTAQGPYGALALLPSLSCGK
jgi:hypothetical protein